MAEEIVINGLTSQFDNQSGESFYDVTHETDSIVSELAKKIEALEGEKSELTHENEETKEKLKVLTVTLEGLKRDEATMKENFSKMETEMEVAEEGKQALESIAARAFDLETEVSRLQHDLISVMSEGEDANKEIVELKKVVAEKGDKVVSLEKEIEELKNAKEESEKQVGELEKKITTLEVTETEVKSEKVRSKEEMGKKIDEKNAEVLGLKTNIEELESVIVKNGLNLEKLKKEKTDVEKALRESEEKARNLELTMVQLQKGVVEGSKVTTGLKDKAIETINGINLNKEIIGGEGKGFVGLNLQQPVVAIGSTGAVIVAAAVIYLYYGRRR